MRKLELDFCKQRRRTWTGWALLLAGLAICVDAGFSYVGAQRELKDIEQRTGKAVRTRSVASYTPEEFAQAQEIIARISVPWNDLFKAVETVKVEKVALMSIDPDPQAGTVMLGGEAGDMPALLTYVARLSNAGHLAEVHLVRHEVRQDGNPQRPLAFSISARWRARS